MTASRPTHARALSGAAAALALSAGLAAADITFWTIETQPARLARQQEMAAAFEERTGTAVEVVAVPEADLDARATDAAANEALPDVIYHPLQNMLSWAEAGILDIAAASRVIDALGSETFASGALEMAAVEGGYAAVPVDGWTQMLLYRRDLFEAAGLAAPTTYDAVRAALEALHEPPRMYGFVAPTKPDKLFMSQVLEHVFLANGVSPVGAAGLAALDRRATGEALDFYRAVVAASPPGELSWEQARALYLSGEAAMIFWSPFILDELAGLSDSAPPTANADPTSRDLAGRTGFVTTFSGPSKPDGAAWADIRYFGITEGADTEAASEFVRYSMDEGYAQTLSIAPEGKFPVRRGTADDPARFTNAWAALPVGLDRTAPLDELYDSAVIDRILGGLDDASRWGVAEGQLALASRIVSSRAIDRIVRRHLDGEIDTAEAIAAMNEELGALQ